MPTAYQPSQSQQTLGGLFRISDFVLDFVAWTNRCRDHVSLPRVLLKGIQDVDEKLPQLQVTRNRNRASIQKTKNSQRAHDLQISGPTLRNRLQKLLHRSRRPSRVYLSPVANPQLEISGHGIIWL